MKHFQFTIFAFFVGLCALSACSKPVEEEPVIEAKSHIRVNVSPFYFQVEDMGTTRTDLSEVSTRLSFAVFDEKGNLVESVVHHEVTDETFGVVEMDLHPGVYQLVAVAHNGDDNASISSTTSIVLPGTRLTDTFSSIQELTVESNKEYEFTMNLPRVTSAFAFRLADTPPANFKEIQVVLNTGGSIPASLEFNPTTGLASNNWKFTCTIPAEKFKEETPIYFIKLFEQTVVNIEATAYDEEGEVIISHTISNVSLVPGKKTTATGYFFKSSGSGSFTVIGDWTTEEIPIN